MILWAVIPSIAAVASTPFASGAIPADVADRAPGPVALPLGTGGVAKRRRWRRA